MRRKKAIRNIFFSFVLEAFALVSGFIIPRLIISTFGSETNGLLNSIASFIGYVGLLQSGMGSVAKASLYKPLAEKNTNMINTLVATIESFFRKIALITVVYVSVLSIFYPIAIANNLDFVYVASLVIIIGVGTVAQYYFGITYQMLVEADQNSYIYSILQTVSVIINTLLVILFVKLGCSIQVVKLASATIFLLRPFCLNIYVRKKYHINRKAKQDKSLLKQRWDGFWQAIAFFIHSKTDVFVLTVFSSFAQVSIYGVYVMVTTALTTMVKIIDKAMNAVLGNIYALNETTNMQKTFKSYCTLTHMIATILFSTAAVTVSSFVKVYTYGINDVNYVQPLFSVVIITAEMLYCLRLPYNSIIYVAGRFRDTRNSALIEAAINIVVSCMLVFKFGLVGVACGTLVAMIYRTIYFIVFLKNNIIKLNVIMQFKRYAISLVLYLAFIFLSRLYSVTVDNYLLWAVYAGCVFIVISIVTILVNLLFYKKEIIEIVAKSKRIKKGKK